jgi:hypothetical protein
LAAIRANRDGRGRTRRPEVYLDETFVNVNHRQPLTWNTPGALVNVPAGVGERLIMVDAIIQDDVGKRYGWVAGAPTFQSPPSHRRLSWVDECGELHKMDG